MLRHCTGVLDSKRNDSRVGNLRIRDFQISDFEGSIIDYQPKILFSTSDLDSCVVASQEPRKSNFKEIGPLSTKLSTFQFNNPPSVPISNIHPHILYDSPVLGFSRIFWFSGMRLSRPRAAQEELRDATCRVWARCMIKNKTCKISEFCHFFR